MHLYSENDVWPSQIDLIDDSDAPNATNTNTAPECLADRTKFAAARTLCGGFVPSVWNGNSPGDLTAIAAPLEFETRTLPGLGTFVYRGGAANAVDNLYVINGPAGVGRWLCLDHTRQIDRYIAFHDGFSAGSTNIATGSGNCVDPGGRHAGTANGYNLVTTSTFTARANDVFDISWAATVRLRSPATADLFTDAVVGVCTNYLGFAQFVPASIDRSHQRTADVVAGGSWSGGDALFNAECFLERTGWGAMSRRTRFTFVGSGSVSFTLAAGQDGGDPLTNISQGAYLSVTQYRVFI